MIVKVSSDEATLAKEKTYINKLNMVLVQVRMDMGHLCNGDRVRVSHHEITSLDSQARMAPQLAIFHS